jgi:Restriction endonuclease
MGRSPSQRGAVESVHDRQTPQRLIMLKTGKNTGLSYELVVQGIFQAIHKQEEVGNLVVERNKTLKGKTTSHQIDVYWKFEQAGISYETVVQVKDWKNPVKLGQLIEFKGVLDDLPGQPRGVFVTRTGYQKGAKQFAAAHDIILYALSEPAKRPNTQITPLGWIVYKAEFRTFRVPSKNPDEGLIDELAMGLNTRVFQPVYSNFVFQIDSPWCEKNLPDVDRSQIELNTLPNAEVIFYDQKRAPASNLDEIVRQELAIMKNETLDRKRVDHVFSGDTFLGPPCTSNVFVKINKVAFDLEIKVSETPADFNPSGFVKLVLREIPSDKMRTFLARKLD